MKKIVAALLAAALSVAAGPALAAKDQLLARPVWTGRGLDLDVEGVVAKRPASGLALETKTPIVPVVVGDLMRTFLFWRELFDAGVFTNPVVPPAVPPDSCRLRTSYSAAHTDEQLDFVLEAFARVGRRVGVI